MSTKRFADDMNQLNSKSAKADSKSSIPGISWELSQEAAQAIREVEANIQAAEQKSGQLLLT